MGTSNLMDYIKGHESAPGEGKLVQKIDFFILTFCCLSYFMNYLDRSNLTAAYVSGMKTDLKFHGNQFNVINTCFTVGYTVGQVPSNIALRYIRPRYFFPGMMLAWAGLTMCSAAAQHPRDLMAIRFFQGIAESSTFVGTHYILGAWYTETELGKRSGLFTSSGLAGTMFGGFLQTAIHSGLNGTGGLAGWRWLFIIDGLITIPIALYGLFLFPDTPRSTKAPYLSDHERALAISRIPDEKEALPLNFSFLLKVLSSWQWYGFVMLWVIAGETESFSSNSLISLWLQKKGGYTVSQLNDYPTGVPAVGIVSTLFWATLTDYYGGKRYLVGYFITVVGLVTSIMILVAGSQNTVSFVAYYLAGTVYACQATFFAWANDAMRFQDETFRGVVLASMNMMSNAVNAWWSIIFYGATYAPYFTRGMWAMIATCIALGLWTTGLLWMTVKAEKKRLAVSGEAIEAKEANLEGRNTETLSEKV
ncbi:Pantothenate transporter liz1 [Hyphodiscus hymeniophilus]|uniref:Pantothenate transporter liz1 n=1 Tax=Hyphodiscus hymeniophilus TaxID=353542 RepID=A0A9P6VGQ2_9HELO|nr:Pantothenate transporter liz1 [Hyphodiscus hymeniophilus]